MVKEPSDASASSLQKCSRTRSCGDPYRPKSAGPRSCAPCARCSKRTQLGCIHERRKHGRASRTLGSCQIVAEVATKVLPRRVDVITIIVAVFDQKTLTLNAVEVLSLCERPAPNKAHILPSTVVLDSLQASGRELSRHDIGVGLYDLPQLHPFA